MYLTKKCGEARRRRLGLGLPSLILLALLKGGGQTDTGDFQTVNQNGREMFQITQSQALIVAL